ncbi:Type I restriction-modification system, specificity subunit S [Staphylococcus aureus]|uniref:restriction endonuclease subunit S n=1 Tax=Staphylococcus aureus TaxID=1280 RepID=UPI0004485448|nr:restriction endonuclease subunit S [Staphylococcus aureus]EZV35849.1 hypothetical protein U961_02502 [Staphylococcus aureus 150211/pool 1]CAC8512455.1 Type I restriction-modification system, specificity subunit S [Staphylococcus aureus]CAC8556156.1 Type I restriction-modification system, specificity subunit S [Staphylococcus aureus]
MSNTQKNIPELRFPEFESEWEEKKLGDVANIVGGGTPKTEIAEYWNGEINWYSPVEIGDKTYVYESKNKITQLGLKKSSAKILPIGTVLFTSRAGIGSTAILKKEGATNQGFQSIIPKNGFLDTYFIFSRTKELKRYGEIYGAGSTFVEISGKEMAKMQISIPVIEEQQKIGDFFSKLDRQIELEEQKLEKLEEQKKGYMQKIFSQELRFKDENGNDYPDWKKEKLDNILEFESERTKVENEYPVLTSSRNGLILQSEYYKEGKTFADSNIGYFIIPKGYITYRSRSDDGKFQFNLNNIIDIGIVSKYYPVFRGINMNQSFLTMLMNHQLKKEYIKFATGTSQLVLSQRNLREISTELPITEEQEKIGNFFDKQNSLIEKQSNKVELLKERKKGFLQKMFI